MSTSLRSGALAAYAALYVAVFGLPLIAISDPVCRFVGSGTQDYASDVSEPAHTGAPLAFACAIAVFPVAFVDFVYFLVKGLGACGLGLL